MAVYVPASTREKAKDICCVSRAECKEGFTCYVIDIRVPPYKWQVKRRYRQFVELHEKLVKQFSIPKLPPKKLLGNRTESFINERQKGLEVYLQSLLLHFAWLPEPLILFLDFEKYEIRAMTAALSEILFSEGEKILVQGDAYEFTPLQLHAITERLKLEDPTCYSNNPKQDIAHLIEFVTQLKHLKIVGNSQPFESSNIISNHLPFDLSMFKSVQNLKIFDCIIERNLVSTGTLRSQLKLLKVYQSLSDLSHLLLCEILHWCPTNKIKCWPFWNSITEADFSHNNLTRIHPCIKLLHAVRYLNLSHNNIELIENLETLSGLSVLILSNNNIGNLDSLHTYLGNIHYLNLSSNKIKHLHGFSKLFSISELNLENNLISSISEVSHFSKLPCLEILNLQNNPVTFNVDYRSQVLLIFGPLSSEIILDGLKTTEKEIDTISVLQALKIARGENMSDLKAVSSFAEAEISRDHLATNLFSVTNSRQECNEGENTSRKALPNSEISEFRQHVENLRRVGGRDWLRLLNEMHCPSKKVKILKGYENSGEGDAGSSDIQFSPNDSYDMTAGQDISTCVTSMSTSFEISYPDWLMFLDSTNQDFKHRLMMLYLQATNLIDIKSFSNKTLMDSKVFWAVLLQENECSYETPVCVLILEPEIVIFKLINFSCNFPETVNHVFKHYPNFIFLKSVSLQTICTLSLGPCQTYVELRVKGEVGSNNLSLLMLSKENINTFVSECQQLCTANVLQKINPFADNMLDVEEMKASLSVFQSPSVAKQIIFIQRVCISKVFHKYQNGILHYILITPSHVMLVEEDLNYSQISSNFLKSQFQVCALVNIYTNVKQIHLKDIDCETDCELCNLNPKEEKELEAIPKNGELDILYKCGSWLIIEFESSVLLYLNFFKLKQRNDFLNSFLGARNQK